MLCVIPRNIYIGSRPIMYAGKHSDTIVDPPKRGGLCILISCPRSTVNLSNRLHKCHCHGSRTQPFIFCTKSPRPIGGFISSNTRFCSSRPPASCQNCSTGNVPSWSPPLIGFASASFVGRESRLLLLLFDILFDNPSLHDRIPGLIQPKLQIESAGRDRCPLLGLVILLAWYL